MRTLTMLAILLILVPLAAHADEAARDNSTLLSEADRTFNSRDYAGATDLYAALADKAEAEGDTVVLVQALAMTARGYLIQGKKEQGREWLQRAADLACSDEPSGWSRYLGVKGRFEWQDDKKDTATQTFESMYAYCMEHELYSRAIDAAHMVAITGAFEQQIEWAHRGIVAAEKGGEDGWLGPLWNNLGVTWWDRALETEGEDALKYNTEALECYLKARDYHWKTGGEINKLIADWAVGSAYRRAGEPQKAGAWLRPVLAWAERLYELDPTPENGEWIGWASFDLGMLAADAGESGRALELLTTAKELLDAVGIQEWDPASWETLNIRIKETGGE